MSQTVEVRLGDRSYPVRIGSGILGELGVTTHARARGARACVVTDPTVDALYGARARTALEGAGYGVSTALVEDGERAKSLTTAEMLYGRLVDAGHERSDVVVALGGGVVGDVAGFVAGTYMRGVPFVQVPTTLLAQVDASVGGKVAVDLPQGKNLVGLFWQPRLVLADVETLDSLPERQIVAGLAEVVKTALLSGGEFLEFVHAHLEDLIARRHERLVHAIMECVTYKAGVVQRDEQDHGERALLNLGHTTAHALEQQGAYVGMLHGEAVAVGLLAAAYVAEEAGLSSGEEAAGQRVLVRRLGVGVPEALDVDALVAQMYRDKKTEGGKLRFVLLGRAGQPVVKAVDGAVAVRALERLAAEERPQRAGPAE